MSTLILNRFLFVIVLLSIQHCVTQDCASVEVQKYAQALNNASQAVLIEIDVIANNFISGFNSSNISLANSSHLFEALTSAFQIETTEDDFTNFQVALDQITDSYFEACYGAVDERPTPTDAGALVYALIAGVNNLTADNAEELLPELRKAFGRITCLLQLYSYDELLNNTSNTTVVPPIAPTPASATVTPTSTPASTNTPTPVETINCTNLGGTYISIAVFYQCIHSDDLQPIFGLGPIVNIDGEDVALKRCIGFVVDTTGSMGTEISYVKELIIDFLDSESILPACYALVDFNDYGYSSPEANVGTAKIYDPLIEYSTESSQLTLSTGGTVYGSEDLRNDVNALYAHSGGDCPEYGMTGILKLLTAISTVEGIILPTNGKLHHVIVLTDASAKDDYRYQEVINEANTVRAVVHFFYSGSYCGTLANYETVRTATGGIRVDSITDFGAFATFINTYNNAGGTPVSRRKRTNLFTECATSHTVTTTYFTSSLNILFSTCNSQSSVYITKPDGTTQTLSVSGTLVLYSVKNPPPGQWIASVSTGNIKISVSQAASLSLDISYTKVEKGKIIPTSDIPEACTQGTIIATTPQLPLLSLNHSLFLEFLNESGFVVEQTTLTECSGILSGEATFPPSSLVFYQLRGHDIGLSPFVFSISGYDDLTFQPPSFIFELVNINPIPIAPSQTSQVKATIYYDYWANRYIGVHIDAVVSPPSLMTVNFLKRPQILHSGEFAMVSFEVVGANTISPGSSLSLNISIVDNCKLHQTNVSIPVVLCNPISVTVTNSSTLNSEYSLLIAWNEPIYSISGVLQTYRLLFEFENKTKVNVDVSSSNMTYMIEQLKPYELVYVQIIAYNNSGTIVGCSARQMFRSKEGIPSQVSYLNYTYITNTTLLISWGQPIMPNGVILYYNIMIQQSISGAIFQNSSLSSNNLTFNVTELNIVYTLTVRAVTSQGYGPSTVLVIYPNGGVFVTDFEGIALGSTSIYLSWSSITLPGSNHFKIRVNELETERTWIFFSVETHATILSLHPYYHYICEVAIVTNITYPYSPAITVITLQSAPTAPPISLSHTTNDPTTLNITWLPPPLEQQNGVISYYIVRFLELESGIFNEMTSSNTWILLENLHPFYNYQITVGAVTIALGPFTSAYYVTMPEDAPTSSPRNISGQVLSSTSVILNWHPPPVEHQNGLIREYRIDITEINSNSSFSVVSQNLSTIIGSLHPNYYYDFSISAITILTGPPSVSIRLKLLEDAPSGSPNNFNATVTSPYSAVLTWAPPSSDHQNGIIIGYIINVTILETNETLLLFSNITSLTVNGLRPFRNYICIIAAQTSIGIGPYSAVFIITTPQDAPSAPPIMVHTLSITSNEFTINWNPPGYNDQNGVIIYYSVSVVEVETGSIFHYTSYTTTLTIQFLHPAYTYQYRIAAYTIGLGPYSDPINITTAEEAPSQAPQSLSGIASSSTSITFSWSPPLPEYRNGLIISYYVNITLLETGTSVYYTTTHTTFTISGLIPYTSYSCIVAAETSIGRGPFTTLFTITTPEDAPNSPPVITTHYAIDSSTVAFQWDPPPPQDHNGIIREYVVAISIVGSNETQTQTFTGTTAIIGSLIPSFTYQFTVAAYTIASGPYSTSVNITLPEDVPSGFPQDVSVNNTTPYSISLMWTSPPPNQQNGAIIRYVINVTHADTLENIQYYSTVTSITITGLDPYTTYVCVVAAETTIGVGPFSHLFFVQTKEAAPDSPPQHPSAISLSPTSIHITWDPPILQDHNGVIREYRINITEALTGLQIQEITNQTQIIIDELKPYHIYHCYIVAVTVDEGPYTVAVSVLTEEAAPSAPPQSLVVSVTSSTSMFISWDPPPALTQNGIIREYSIIVHNVKSGVDLTFFTLHTQLNISVLSPYTTYSVKVAAITVASGPFTNTFNVTTLQDVPTSPPEQFNASAVNGVSLQLQWSPPNPSGTNGIIQYYNITIVEQETSTVFYSTTTFVSIIISNLHPYYTYKCTVSAVTLGNGPVASLVIQMPEEAPASGPDNIISTHITSTVITIMWDELPSEDENGIIRYYHVNVTETNTGYHYQTTSTTTDISLSNLHPYYTYSISVAAYTIEEGPFSTPVFFTTLQDVPSSPPTSLSITVESSSVVYIEWSPPPSSEQNGVITGYNISLIDTTTGHEIYLVSYNISISVDSLHPYTIYQYRIAAFTSVGLGPYSNLLTFQTQESAPSLSPKNVSVVTVTSTTIKLSWLPPPPNSHNGIIRSYVVTLQETNTGTILYYNVTDTEITVSSLHPYYMYECRIAAVTVSTGPFSTTLTIITKQAAPSGPPTGVAVIAVDSFTLNVTWEQPPIDQINGIIQSYTISVSVMETLDHYQYTSYSTSLLLTELHPYYTYTVLVAAVTVGTGPYSIGYTIKTPSSAPSGPPQNISGIAISSTKLQVSWEPPLSHHQNGMIQSYTVTVFEVNTNTTHEVHQDIYHSTITLTGLHPYYEYKLSVAAYTVGLGPSSFVYVTTLQDAPTGSPRYLTVNVTSSSTVRLHWSPPESHLLNGVIQHYIVILNNNETGQSTLLTSEYTNIYITNLHPFYTYSCSVVAVTVGSSPAINISFQMPEDVPSASPNALVVSFITSTRALLSWSPPLAPEHNGVITGYSVTIVEITSSETVTYTTTNHTLTVTALLPYTNYKFTVAASTNEGLGPNSDFLSFQTLQDAPSASPSNVMANNVSSNSFILNWQPPPQNTHNGIIIGYDVTTLEINSGITYTNFTSHTSIVLNFLHPYYQYNCTVAPVTVSVGPTSDIVTIQTLQAASSSPPRLLVVTAMNSHSINISWSPPPLDKVNGIIQYYFVNISVMETSQTLYFQTTDTSVSLNDVHPHYTYTVVVAAVTIAIGPFSTEQSITTPQDVPSGQPQNVSAVVLNATAIQLYWSPPLEHEQNGIITSYTVVVFEVNTNSTIGSWSDNLKSNVIIGNLHPFYEYRLLVGAATVIGLGPFYEVQVQTDQAAPRVAPQDVLVNVTSSSSVTIQWSPPDLDEQNGVIVHYMVTILDTQSDTSMIYNVTELVLYINDLHPFYIYKCSVTAVTIDASPEAVKFFQMLEDVPSGPPTNVTITVLSYNSLIVTWFPPIMSLQNGVIKEYTVIITNVNTKSSQTVSVINKTNTILSELKSFHTYSILVSASTVGLGPFAEPVTIQMPESSPGSSPSNFLAEKESNLTLHLSWVSPPKEDHNGIILGYELTCSGQNNHTISIKISGTSVSLFDLQNNTHYTCTVCAYTSAGCGPYAVTYVSTYTNSPVGPPHSLTASTTATEIHLQWQTPFDPESVIQSFAITYQLIDTVFPITTPRVEVTIADITNTTYVVQPLLVSSTYKLVVFAVTTEGTGPASEKIVVTTNEPALHAPQNLKCLPTSSKNLLCTWEAPSISDYLVTSYELSYKLVDGFDYYPGYGEVLGVFTLSSETQQYDISDLLPYGGYQIEVKVHLSPIIKGSGYSGDSGLLAPEELVAGSSTTVNITYAEAPTVPVKDISLEVVSPTSVRVSWKPPNKKEWKGKINTYKITATRLGPNQGIEKRAEQLNNIVTVVPQANNPDPSLAMEPLQPEYFLIKGLEENYEYTFSINIINAGGSGLPSTPISQIMPQAAPSGPPVNITLVSVSISSINITWLPPHPLDANGIITGYRVLFTRIEIKETTEYILQPEETSFFKSGLHYYENVSIQIAAKTVVGWGPWSSEHYFFTSEDRSSPPQSLKATIINDTTIVLTWKRPVDAKGVIVGYQVIYSGYGRSTVERDGPYLRNVPISENLQVVITSLVPGLFYEFKVRAINGAGNGNNASVLIALSKTDTTSGTDSAEGELGRDTILSIAIPVGSTLAIIIVLVLLVLCIVRTIKRNKKQKQDLIYDEPTFAINPLTQLPIHDTAPDVPLRSFTLREDVRTVENEYDIGTTQMNFADEIEDPKLTDDRNEHNESDDEEAEEQNELSYM